MLWFPKLLYCKYFIFNYVDETLISQEQIVLIETREKWQLNDGNPWVLRAGDPKCYNIVQLQFIFFIFVYCMMCAVYVNCDRQPHN